jgi:hypothetical protein
MANAIHDAVAVHFAQGANRRIVIAAPGSRRSLVLTPADLPELRAEGAGLRFRKVFIFACQVRFARVA